MVATPIGNLEDITLRALRTLKEASVVFAEDTRVAAKLLARYEIEVSVHRLDAEIEAKIALEVIKRLEEGLGVVFKPAPLTTEEGYLKDLVKKERYSRSEWNMDGAAAGIENRLAYDRYQAV